MIEVMGLTKRFGGTAVLNGIRSVRFQACHSSVNRDVCGNLGAEPMPPWKGSTSRTRRSAT